MNTSKRWALLLTILGLCLTLLSGCGGETAPPAGAAAPSGDGAAVSSGDVVTVGVLHSLSGTMAMAESPMVDAVKMAVDEINAQGGVLGRQISYIVEDGASDPATFAEKATKLLTSDGVATVFGCWTSASRKAVLPVFEGNNGLLWYPVQYEGLETSHNIMYTAACPNQQAIPAVEYLLEAYKGEDGVLKLYLAGSDYVYPRTTNTEIKAWAAAKGVEIVGEDYVVLGGADFQQVITKIRQSDADVIVNTINGDSNVAFFKQYKDAGLTPEQIQTVSFSACEEDIRGMGAEYAVGHLFAWNYFQTTDTPENKTFVEKYKALYGADRVTDDPIQDAYNGVYLWAQAVEKAGAFDTESVIAAVEAGGIEFRAPEGLVTIDPSNHHLYKIVRIGAANADGQIDEIWVTPDRVKPDPWMETYDWASGLVQQ